MSLAHAILGILTISPMTGYDLKHQAFDISIAHFWQADQAQIYRTLTSLADSGWVQSTIEYQAERPNRKVYTITEAGREELRRWLHTEQPLAVHREPFLVQLFFAGLLDPAAVLAQIAHQRALHQANLDRFAAIPMPALDDPTLDYQRTFWRLTLEMGVALEKMYLDWLAQCEATVRRLANGSTPDGSS